MSDLWPEEFGELDVIPPLTILREQADAITAKTKQRIRGQVTQMTDRIGRWDFTYVFDLVAPFLDEYTYGLFRISHDLVMYPVLVSGNMLREEQLCPNSDDFIETLREVFASDDTKRVIKALLSQTAAAMESKPK